jgi:hypothetical protein
VIPTPAFRLYLLSRAAAWIGASMTLVALPVLLYQRTGNAALTGLLAALEAVPYLLLGLPVGALADRWDRRRTMVVTGVLGATVLATVPLAVAVDLLTTPHVFAVGLAVATLFVFTDAAGFGALPEIVGRDRVAEATGALVTVSTVIGLLGPAAAGVLTAGLGAAVVLALDAAAALLAAVLLHRARWTPAPPPPSQPGSLLVRTARDAAEGVRYIWRHPVVRSLTLLGVGNSISGGAVTGLLVVVGVRQLGLSDDDGRLGLLYAATAAGAVLIGLGTARIQQRLPTGTITLLALAVAWLGTVAWAFTTTLAVGLVVLAVWQAASTLAIVNGIVVRQAVTPARLQGRVNTTARMIAWGGAPLGAGVGGLIAEAVDTRAALLVASTGVAVSLAVGLATGLRRVGTLQSLVDEAQAAERTSGK